MKKLRRFLLVLLFIITLFLALSYFFLIPFAKSKTEIFLTKVGISNVEINGLTITNLNGLFLAELGFIYRTKNQIITVKAKNVSFDFLLERDKRLKPTKLSVESLLVIHREKTKEVVTQDQDYNNLLFKNYADIGLPRLEIHNLKIKSSLLKTGDLEITSLKVLTLLEKSIFLSAEFNSRTAYNPKAIKGNLKINLNPFKITGNASSDLITLTELNLNLKKPRLEFEIKDLANKKLIIKNSSFSVFNGNISGTGSFLFDGSSDLNISLKNLDLKSLMDYYPQDKIKAEGSISGTLPLKIKNGAFTITNGKVKAIAPGKIKAELFSENESTESTSLNPQLALLSEALKNYNYSSLSSELNLSKKGDLQIALHLKGNNPDFQNGREVNLNIDITENIPALIKTLRLTSSLEESLAKR